MPVVICAICGETVLKKHLIAHCRLHAAETEKFAAPNLGIALGPKDNRYTLLFCPHCGKEFGDTAKKHLKAHIQQCRLVLEIEANPYETDPVDDGPPIIMINPDTDAPMLCTQGRLRDLPKPHRRSRFFRQAYQ